MQRSSVDLPLPEAPMRQTTSCRADRQVDAVEHDLVAVGLPQSLDLQHGPAHRAPARSRSMKRRPTWSV